MVDAALEGSAGVKSYETTLADQQTVVKFDKSQIDEETLMNNIKKLTGYNNLYLKQ